MEIKIKSMPKHGWCIKTMSYRKALKNYGDVNCFRTHKECSQNELQTSYMKILRVHHYVIEYYAMSVYGTQHNICVRN